MQCEWLDSLKWKSKRGTTTNVPYLFYHFKFMTTMHLTFKSSHKSRESIESLSSHHFKTFLYCHCCCHTLLCALYTICAACFWLPHQGFNFPKSRALFVYIRKPTSWDIHTTFMWLQPVDISSFNPQYGWTSFNIGSLPREYISIL